MAFEWEDGMWERELLTKDFSEEFLIAHIDFVMPFWLEANDIMDKRVKEKVLMLKKVQNA